MMVSTVWLLTVDSLRADKLRPEYFSESWEFFESDFSRFSSAYSHGVATPFAFPGLIAGVPPTGDGTLPDTPILTELSSGRTVIAPNNPHLHSGRGYRRGVDAVYPEPDQSPIRDSIAELRNRLGKIDVLRHAYRRLPWTSDNEGLPYRPADLLVDDFRSELTHHNPEFCWFHFQDVHYPFVPEAVRDRDPELPADSESIADLNERFRTSTGSTIPAESQEMDIIETMYEENIRFFDRQLCSLLEFARQNNHFEDTLIVLTADHGEAFGSEGVQNHQWDAKPIDALVKIPLLIHYPDKEPGTQDHLVQHADVFQQMAGILDDKPPTEPWRHNPLDSDLRRVISKSNRVIRGTDSKGSCFRSREGSLECEHSPDEETISRVENAVFPTIVDPEIDTAPGVDDAETRNRLRKLGYIE